MTDREKIICELKEGIDFAIHRCHCGLAVTMKMALALLEEQEPVEPHKMLPRITRPIGGYVCGHCGIRFLEKNDYYCPNCGRAVKWN